MTTVLYMIHNYFVTLEKELHDEVEFVLGDGEDDKSVLKRDAVFAKLNFCLDSGSFKVLGNKTLPESGEILLHILWVMWLVVVNCLDRLYHYKCYGFDL